ncbi:MAG: alpha/beta fold hydrolase [Acidimicrobiales bacterium]
MTEATTTTIRPVRVGDVTLEIAEAGVAGRPLLLVHGFTGAKEDFQDWFGGLAARGWHVVAPDLRGHGASDHPPRAEDYSLDLFGQVVALHHADRLDGLVLMDTIPGPVPGNGVTLFLDALPSGTAATSETEGTLRA